MPTNNQESESQRNIRLGGSVEANTPSTNTTTWGKIHSHITYYLPSGMKDFEIENLCKSIEKLFTQERKLAQEEQTEHLMKYLWYAIRNDYKDCSIEYFLKDQSQIMGITLPDKQ